MHTPPPPLPELSGAPRETSLQRLGRVWFRAAALCVACQASLILVLVLSLVPAGLGHSHAAGIVSVLAILVLPAVTGCCGFAGFATLTRSGCGAGLCAVASVLASYVLLEFFAKGRS